MVFSWFAHTGSYVTPVGGKEGGKKEKTTLFKTCFSRGLPIRALMSPLWEARKEEKRKKPHFGKRGFFVVCPYGPLCYPCGRQGRRKKRKTTLCKTWFFRGLPIRALMSPLWEARKEVKTKKPTLCKTWFFRGLPVRALMSPLWEARKEEKTKKTHFVKRGFFVVCQYWPLWHPCTHDHAHSSMRLCLKAC